MSTPNRITEFRAKLRALITEYDVSVEVKTGYYGDSEGVDFCIDGKRVVHVDCDLWAFDDSYGCKSVAQLRADDRAAK